GVGVICTNGLVVVDVDHPDDPTAPELPETAVVATQTPGCTQHYFRTDDDGDLRTRAFAWGEIRTAGAYCVAPTSPGEDGGQYEWRKGLDELEIAVLPESLRELARTKPARTETAWLSQKNALFSLGFIEVAESAPREHPFSLGVAGSEVDLERLDTRVEVV